MVERPAWPAARRAVFRAAAWAAAVAGLVAVPWLFERFGWDVALADRCFDAAGDWRVGRRAALPLALFYRGPKVALVAFGLYLVVCAVAPRLRAARFGRRTALYLLLAMALVPASVGWAKRLTGVHCPYELARYGGTVADSNLFHPPPPGSRPGRCFPAAHASGGFALVALFFVTRRRRRWGYLALALAAGWTMGLYQMLRGSHFASHTVVSMLWALVAAAALAALFGLPEESEAGLGGDQELHAVDRRIAVEREGEVEVDQRADGAPVVAEP